MRLPRQSRFQGRTVLAGPGAAPPPLPPALWDVANAQDLLAEISGVGAEGLNPADYDPAGLRRRSRAATRC